MSGNPLTEKVALPYARALFDFSVEKNIMHQITADFQNLDIFFNESSELTDYLNSPVVSQEAKREVGFCMARKLEDPHERPPSVLQTGPRGHHEGGGHAQADGNSAAPEQNSARGR